MKYVGIILILAGVLFVQDAVSQGDVHVDYAQLTLRSLPPVQGVTEAAMQELPEVLANTHDWVKRIRRSALFPEVELRLYALEELEDQWVVFDSVETERISGHSESEEIYTGSTTPGGPLNVMTERREIDQEGETRTTHKGKDSYRSGSDETWLHEYGLFLTWDLSKLVFHEEEMEAAELHVRHAEFRYKFIDDVVDWYYELKETLMYLEDEAYASSPKMHIQKEKLAFLLDSLTGDYISGWLAGNADRLNALSSPKKGGVLVDLEPGVSPNNRLGMFRHSEK